MKFKDYYDKKYAFDVNSSYYICTSNIGSYNIKIINFKKNSKRFLNNIIFKRKVNTSEHWP